MKPLQQSNKKNHAKNSFILATKFTNLTHQWKWGEIAKDRKSKQRAHVCAEKNLDRVSNITQIPKLDMQPSRTTTN